MDNWIDIASFTPVSALVGGVSIGLAAVVLILGIGHVLGMSGITYHSLQQVTGGFKAKQNDMVNRKPLLSWQMLFLLSMIVTTWVYALVIGFPEFSINQPTWKLVLAGLLVGFGTRLGSGCTSGHGVCGLSRLSGRSLVATLIFMTTGMLTASLFAL